MWKYLAAWLKREPNNLPDLLDEVDIVFGPTAHFSGMLQCNSTVILEGYVENARIETAANIIIAESARVTCDVSARIVSIRGHYSGTLEADRAEILEGAQVNGHVHVNTIYIDDNAVMNADMYLLGAAPRVTTEQTEITTDVITRTSGDALRPPPEIGT